MRLKHNLFPISGQELFKDFDRMFESTYKEADNYPPYNVYSKDESTYIDVAVSGFEKEWLEIYVDDEGDLNIVGTKPKTDEKIEFHHKGLSTRNFHRKFMIMKNYTVADIQLKNGILNIRLDKETPNRKVLEIK